jgi:hypothetical protein
LLGFQKGAPKQVDVHEGTWKVFGVWSREEPINKEMVSGSHHPSMSLWCAKGFWGEWERQR